MKLTVSNPFDTAYKKLDDVIVFENIIPPVYQDWLLLCANNPDLAWYRKDNAITDIPEFIGDARNVRQISVSFSPYERQSAAKYLHTAVDRQSEWSARDRAY